MKKSRYNILSSKSNLLFNTMSRSLAVLSNEDYNFFVTPNSDFSDLDENTFKELYDSGFIIDDDRDEIAEVKRAYWQSKFDKTVLHITIMTTLNCNFRCTYCFEEHRDVNLTDCTLERIKKMVELKLQEGYSRLSIDWYGGEPLLNMSGIKELSQFFIQLCNERAIEYVASITTNGYTFSPDIQRELFSLGVAHAQITLDGSKEIHDKRRILLDGNSSFDTIKNNIINACEGMTISLRINVDSKNCDDLINLIDSFKDHRSDLLGIYACIVTPSLGSSYMVGDSKLLMKSIVKMYAYALAHGFRINNVNSLLAINYRACIVDSDSHYIITPSGELFKCGESYGADDVGLIGKILESGEMRIDDKRQAKWTKDPFSYEECLNCSYLPICMGGCVMKRITRSKDFCSWEYSEHFSDILELFYEEICMFREDISYEKVKV